MNSNGSALDSTVFTFTSATSTFEIESSDTAKVANYNLKVTAKYTGASYINIAELAFIASVEDACMIATLTIDPTIIPTVINFSIYEAADVQALLVSKVTSSEAGTCPSIELSIVVAVDDSAIDGTVFTVDGSSAPVSYSLAT